MGVYSPSEEGEQAITVDDPLLLPSDTAQKVSKLKTTRANLSSSTSSGDSSLEQRGKRKCDGKGSNILLLVRKFMKLPENWKSIENKRDYHFLGSFSKPLPQQLYFIPNCLELEQSSITDLHFLWSDIQLSKGPLNKDRLIEIELLKESGETKTEKNVLQISSLLGC